MAPNTGKLLRNNLRVFHGDHELGPLSLFTQAQINTILYRKLLALFAEHHCLASLTIKAIRCREVQGASRTYLSIITR